MPPAERQRKEEFSPGVWALACWIQDQLDRGEKGKVEANLDGRDVRDFYFTTRGKIRELIEKQKSP